MKESGSMGYKQIIIARKDLPMSSGKLAAQVAHGSMAFMSNLVKAGVQNVGSNSWNSPFYRVNFTIESGIVDKWLKGEYTKIILRAKNKNHLLKAATIAKSIGMVEDIDYFLIYDNCHTELTPEESNHTTLTTIAFRPMDEDRIAKISKTYQLWKDE